MPPRSLVFLAALAALATPFRALAGTRSAAPATIVGRFDSALGGIQPAFQALEEARP